VIAGTDTVITVGYYKGNTLVDVAANQKDRGKFLASLDLAEILGDVRVLNAEQWQPGRPQDVLGLTVMWLPRNKRHRSDYLGDDGWCRDQLQILRCRPVVMVLGFVKPQNLGQKTTDSSEPIATPMTQRQM
jgi:hypothetical protein